MGGGQRRQGRVGVPRCERRSRENCGRPRGCHRSRSLRTLRTLMIRSRRGRWNYSCSDCHRTPCAWQGAAPAPGETQRTLGGTRLQTNRPRGEGYAFRACHTGPAPSMHTILPNIRERQSCKVCQCVVTSLGSEENGTPIEPTGELYPSPTQADGGGKGRGEREDSPGRQHCPRHSFAACDWSILRCWEYPLAGHVKRPADQELQSQLLSSRRELPRMEADRKRALWGVVKTEERSDSVRRGQEWLWCVQRYTGLRV